MIVLRTIDIFPRDGRSAAAVDRAARIAGGCRRTRFMPEGDAALGQIVRRHLNGDAVAAKRLDPVPLHPSGGVSENLMLVIEKHPKTGLGEHVDDGTFKFE